MTVYEQYTFFLCLIVFVALTALFSALLTYVVRLTVRLIRHGAEDQKILKEYYKKQENQKKCGAADWIARIFSGVVCVALFLIFAVSLALHINEDSFSDQYGSLKVVKSSSMAYRYEKNDYLFENSLNDQIQMMDLVVTEPLPNEFDLALYDIVVYEQDGKMIIHRIVGIEEPNAKHPNERYFKLQGDAVESADRYPVRYSQMRAIYRGNRVPFIGSFVAFMQSPAGWLCILLVLFAMIASPLVEKKLNKEKARRWEMIHGRVAAYGSTRGISPVPLAKGRRCRGRARCCKRCGLKGCRGCISLSPTVDIKALNINLETKRGKVFWMHFSLSNQIGCDPQRKKRERK